MTVSQEKKPTKQTPKEEVSDEEHKYLCVPSYDFQAINRPGMACPSFQSEDVVSCGDLIKTQRDASSSCQYYDDEVSNGYCKLSWGWAGGGGGRGGEVSTARLSVYSCDLSNL